MSADKKSDKELFALLADAPCAASLWRHYKGNVYIVVATAIAEATQLPLVIYRPPNSNLCFARPLVEYEGKQMSRFQEMLL